MNRDAGDVTEQGVEVRPAQFAPVRQFEVGIVRQDVGEILVPVRLLKPANLLVFDLKLTRLSLVRVGVVRLQLL